MLLSNLLAAFGMVIFLVVIWLIFYTAGHGWTLGAKRADRRARKEEEPTDESR